MPLAIPSWEGFGVGYASCLLPLAIPSWEGLATVLIVKDNVPWRLISLLSQGAA